MDLETIIHPLMLAQMPGIFHINNINSELVLANKIMVKMAGFQNLALAQGKSYEKMQCPAAESSETFLEQDRMMLKSGVEKKWVANFEYAKNKWYVACGSKQPIQNEEGEIIGFVSHWYDLTHDAIVDLSRYLFVSDHTFYQQQFSYAISDQFDSCDLTGRQQQCIFYLLRGKSSKQIGLILSISSKTVETYVDQLKTKFDCCSKSQLIEKCIDLGMMNFIPESLFA